VALSCPNCREALSPWSLRRHFPCTYCQAPLNANVVACSVVGFVLWGVFDAIAIGISSSDGGNSGISALVYFALSWGALFVILYFSLSNARVTRAV
jgi:hypothetical protein